MKPVDIKQDLAGNSYPGRGIVIGQSADGKQAVVAYFIMGRSVNSRNRVFAEEPDGIRTEAADPAKMEDPSLIIYHPVRQMGRGLIITNGDQTDTIRDFLEKGLPFEQALRTREFEPDGPNWTPRISGLLSPDGSYKLSILKAAVPAACARPSSTRASRAWAISSTPTSAMATPSPPTKGSPPPSLLKGTSIPSPPACGRT